MSNSKAALGFLAGAAAGAILGILFAPESGKETRKKISNKSGDLTDSLKNSFNDFVDGIKSSYAGAKEDAEEALETGKSKFNSYKSEAKNAMS